MRPNYYEQYGLEEPFVTSADDRQVYNPHDLGSRFQGLPPLNIMQQDEARQLGKAVLTQGMIWAFIYSLFARIMATYVFRGFSVATVVLLIEICWFTTISVRSKNDSRFYGLREISLVILSILGLWLVFRTSIAFEGLDPPFEKIICVVELATAGVFFLFMVFSGDKPYEKPSRVYRYREVQDSAFERMSDALPTGLFYLLPFIMPRPESGWGVLLSIMLATSIAARYYYAAIAETLDLVAAWSPYPPSYRWFDSSNLKRHFLFTDVFAVGVLKLFMPLVAAAVGLFLLGNSAISFLIVMGGLVVYVVLGFLSVPRAAFDEMQIVFLGYNPNQRRSSTHYELSPSFESLEVRRGWFHAAIGAIAIALYGAIHWPMSQGIRIPMGFIASHPSVGAASITAFVFACGFPLLWSTYVLGSFYTGAIRDIVDSMRGRNGR